MDITVLWLKEPSFYSPKYGFKDQNYTLVIHFKHNFYNKNPIEIKTVIEPLLEN